MKTRLAKLLKRHRDALEKRGIVAPSSLIYAIRLDVVKACLVLGESHNRQPVDVVCEFFADHPGIVPEIESEIEFLTQNLSGIEVGES